MASKNTLDSSPNGTLAARTAGVPPARSKQKKSKSRPDDYTSEGVKDNDITQLPTSDWNLLGGLTALAAAVRLFRISQPSSVVFDEVHFGGFASKYIKGKFFMDVHPPLGKLLITLAGWLAGFDGEFDFKDIGKDYLEPGVPYVAMRLLPAILGVLTIPLMYLTLKASGCRTTTAALGSGLLIFENGLLTQSRLILLDSPLLIFTAFTAFAFTCFTNQHEQGPSKAFTPAWWFWLAATGVGLGATVGVKWVGLFTIAWVGSLTALQLWVLLGDAKTVTPRLWLKHLFARAFCLIIIPLTFYLALFAIHFLCLVNPGDGDGFMSSEFQSTLNSKAMQDVPADVAFGSRVSIRHWNTQGGYLHSHDHMYPDGSKQQQITLYPHKDDNNIWLMENQTQPEGPTGEPINGTAAWDTIDPPVMVKDGDVIKLYHITTHRRLHSHDFRPPVTDADWQNEASAYGYEGFEGDANDHFRVEIVKSHSDGAEAKTRLRTIQTKFKLVHVMTGCVLFSHKVKLPKWGFEQQEVTCAKGATLPNSIWYIEQNAHPMLKADAEKVNYRNPGFFGKFWELQKVMWTTNAGLTESHAWDSRPPSWPVLRRGINFWGKDNRQIYLIGNALIWWSSTAAILTYIAFKALATLRWQRGYNDYKLPTFKRFDYEIGTSVLGWAFHYFPFYLMQRQLFLHHYFPALYFAIIALCQIFDFATSRIGGFGLKENPMVGRVGAVAFLVMSIAVFSLYQPLAYGNPWTKAECNKLKLLDTWDFDCNLFHTSYEQYSTPLGAASTGSPIIPATDAPPAAQPVDQGGLSPEAEAEDTAGLSPEAETKVTPGAELEGQKVIAREEKIEYRDENGNLLNDEQVAALQGKVSFKTKYETRTRLVDADGNEIGFKGEGDGEDHAGVAALPHGEEETGTADVSETSKTPPLPHGEEETGTLEDAETSKTPPLPHGEQETGTVGEAEASSTPPSVDVEADLEKERSVEESQQTSAEPESSGVEATDE